MIAWLKRSTGRIQIDAHGGGLRAPIVTPFALKRVRARLQFANTFVETMILILLVTACLAALGAVTRMDGRLYVADGSRFGCRVSETGAGAALR